MKIAFKILTYLLLILFLTIITQVAGIVLLLCIPVFFFLKRKIENKAYLRLAKVFSFLAIYLVISIAVVPIVARKFGRVPLPVVSNPHVKPLNYLTCLLNRHYVRPVLKESVERVAKKMQNSYEGTVIAYMDANFPFINSFPLIPHLSHNDGKKIDVALFYIDKESKKRLEREAPSFIGYGVFEYPKKGEYDMPLNCAKKGYRQYGFMEKIIPQWNKEKMLFDEHRTKYMTQLFANEEVVGKIFIEPHLKSRLGLLSKKVRFHGCRAVRHDDHIHVQLK